MAARKMGVEYEMTMKMPMTDANWRRYDWKARGSASSTVFWSLANRLTIRPSLCIETSATVR